MFRQTKALLAAAVIGAAALSAPVAHAVDSAVWSGCSFNTTNDATGQVIGNPNTQTGTVYTDTAAVVNETGGTVSDVTVTCTFKINYGINDSFNIAATRSSTTAGGTGVMADTITFTALPGDDVYLCAKLSWNSSKGNRDVALDGDNNPANGIQCSLATSISAVCVLSDCSNSYVLVCVASSCGGGLVCVASDCDPSPSAPVRRQAARRDARVPAQRLLT